MSAAAFSWGFLEDRDTQRRPSPTKVKSQARAAFEAAGNDSSKREAVLNRFLSDHPTMENEILQAETDTHPTSG